MDFIPINNLNQLLDLNEEAELYALVSSQFNRLNAEFWDAANRRLMDHLYLDRPSRVLDLACGAGRFVIDLAKKHPSLSITGVDFHPQMIQQAKKDAQESGLENIQFLEEDLSHYLFEFKKGSFEIGICLFALSYLGVNKVLKELRRILGPSGQAGVTTSSFNSLTDWHPLFFEFFMENQNDFNFSQTPSVPEQPVDAPDLKKRMEASGFDNVMVEAIQVPLSFRNMEEAVCFLISSTWLSNQLYSIKDKKMRRYLVDWGMKKISALYPPGAPITTSIEFLVGWNQPKSS